MHLKIIKLIKKRNEAAIPGSSGFEGSWQLHRWCGSRQLCRSQERGGPVHWGIHQRTATHPVPSTCKTEQLERPTIPWLPRSLLLCPFPILLASISSASSLPYPYPLMHRYFDLKNYYFFDLLDFHGIHYNNNKQGNWSLERLRPFN